MAKKGRLSKVETFYILNNRELPVAQVAQELDRNVQTIEKCLEDNSEVVQPVVEESPSAIAEVYPKLNAGVAMGRKFRRGKPVSTVMTPSASMLGDAYKETAPKHPIHSNAIHKPLDQPPQPSQEDTIEQQVKQQLREQSK